MILFVKPNCKKLEYIKEAVDLKALDIEIKEVSETCEGLPYLMIDKDTVIKGAINIKNELIKRGGINESCN